MCVWRAYTCGVSIPMRNRLTTSGNITQLDIILGLAMSWSPTFPRNWNSNSKTLFRRIASRMRLGWTTRLLGFKVSNPLSQFIITEMCSHAWQAAVIAFSVHFCGFFAGFVVVVNSISSTPQRLDFGVPQGSVLGPLLFVLYTQSVSRIVRQSGSDLHKFSDAIIHSFSVLPFPLILSPRSCPGAGLIEQL